MNAIKLVDEKKKKAGTRYAPIRQGASQAIFIYVKFDMIMAFKCSCAIGLMRPADTSINSPR